MNNPRWTKANKIVLGLEKPKNGGQTSFATEASETRQEILGRIKEGVASKGFFQLLYGREFIEKSYAFSKTSEGLFGTEIKNYDCASGEYFFDPRLELFWRRTGSFD